MVMAEMKRMSKALQIALVGCVVLLWCMSGSAQDVKYNFVAGTDFSKYKTYKWVKIPNVKYPNQIVDSQITQAIDAQLALKGLSKTEGENPDLYVAYQAAVTQEQQWNSYSTDMGGGWGYGRWGGWGGYGGGSSNTTTTSSTINIGTINLDIYDVGARNQIWRGAATKTLGSGKDPKKVQKNLNKAMAKLLKNFPPPVK